MVEDWLGGFALQLVPLDPVNYVEFLVASMDRSPEQWRGTLPMPGRGNVDVFGRELGARPPASVAGKVPLSG